MRQLLKDIQGHTGYRSIIIFPPSLDWNVQLFLRPQQLDIATSAHMIFFTTMSRQRSKIHHSIDQPPMW